ncbi:SEC-C metal-binding domain-containing protein [Saccharospirillum impatiens]|uniref:YecA/YgfB family protein n=1 Tax=Saccharospirillum impatiens TaxID=169438 RepID=UPI0003F7A060|nr:SEC-C metal-binding domain-containing protein [Saccharospirillum impatiens]
MNQLTQHNLESLAPALADLFIHENLETFKTSAKPLLMGDATNPGLDETEASRLATAIYYAMPLPARGFSSGSAPTPGRNDPCDCGSGKKYKHCCARAGEIPPPPVDALVMLAMAAFGPNHWNALATRPDIPNPLRESMLLHCMQRGLYTEANALAQPLYDSVATLKNRDQVCLAYGLDALAETVTGTERRQRLEHLASKAKAPSIRSLLFQRLAMRCMDSNEPEASRHYLTKAMREDPNQEEMPLTELSILAFTGTDAELKARARWWQVKLEKRYGPDHHWANFLQALVTQGKAAVPDWQDDPQASSEGGAVMLDREAQLHDVLVQAPPEVSDTFSKLKNSESSIKTRANLTKAARQFLNEIYLPETAPPGGKVNRLHLMVELPDIERTWTDPEANWLHLLQAYPGLLGNATVLWTLYRLLQERPLLAGEPVASTDALPALIAQINLYLNTLVQTLNGKATLNRRTLNADAAALLTREHLFDLRSMGQGDMAMNLGKGFLAINPGDQTAVRIQLASLYAEHNKPKELKALIKRYRIESTPELSLSLMQLHATQGDFTKAFEILHKLNQTNPKALHDLRLDVNAPLLPEEDEFQDIETYWELNRRHWRSNPQALEWLKRNLPNETQDRN